MIKDYYSVSYLPIAVDGFIEELNIISRIYRANGIDRIFLAREYDPSVSVSAHLSRTAHYFANARKSLCSGVKLTPIHTVTLCEGISATFELSGLALKASHGSFLYINVPVGITRDVLASELHNIIYKHKLTPVFVSIDSVKSFSSEQVFDTILSVPNAVYQFSLPHITNSDSCELIKQLISEGKNVIFGSGDGFDACPYKNIEFYVKRVKRVIGKNLYGYYLIRHNRFFT